MQQLNEQDQFFSECVSNLKKVNQRIARLLVMKDELTDQIISSLEHTHHGQKTYEYREWKIEVKTPVVYALNKKRYESGEIELPINFNPIKESISYSIDKRLCEQYMLEGPKSVRDSLSELIDVKPGKASVTIKDRI